MTQQITGTVIGGRYKITGYLRDGRMGNVYVARRIDDNAMFAVKILDPSLFGEEEAMRRFEREIRVQSRIDHPNSVHVFEAGKTADGLPWLVQEYIEGDTLAERLEEKGKMPWERAIDVAAQVALALEVAHDIGIVHRDLSPDQIMLVEKVTDDGVKVKVLDFGLAGVADKSADEDTSLTAVGVRVGTPHYMAPEYIEDFECDHRADLYALGIILYQMIVGKPPFDGRPYKVMDKHVNEVPKLLRKLVPDVPEWLEALVAKMLEKQPDERPPSARAVVAAIENGTGQQIRVVQDTHIQQDMEEQAEPTEATMIGMSSVTDPVLEKFSSSLVKTLDRRTGTEPPSRDCLVVERVSKYSLPHELGVKPGTLVQVEEQEEGLLDPTLLAKPTDSHTYVFHVNGEQIRLKTTAALLGMTLARSVENIRTYYNPSNDGPDSLLELWKQGAWEVLERMALRALSGSSGALTGGLFAKFIGGGKPKAQNHPATLFYGAALVETGRGDEGFPFIKEYKAAYAHNWPDVYHAVATAYMGLQRLRAGKRDLGIELLTESYLLEPLQKVRRALEKTTGHAPELRQLYKRKFPPYDLYQTNGYPGANFQQTLATMDDSQILLIVLMGGFRGNIRYNEFMLRYLNYGVHFADFIAGLHVCTTVKDRTSDHRPEWFTGEDLAAAAGLQFLILEDYRAFVQREAKPTRIPTVYAVNRDGVVLHEGSGEAPDLWNAIGRAGQLRMHKFNAAQHG
ncbi:MAG: serine/threonine protein kinase [Alphaproteobacteria bacterium]|nr:serine/threonine protein kinase [Alphaproteobacteria bacterium]